MYNRQSSINSSTINRYYGLFIALLFVSLFLYSYNYFNAWLMGKKYALNSVATKMVLQIEDYRYHANSIFEQANISPFKLQGPVSPMKLRPDVYWLESRYQAIDAIIFGHHNATSAALAQRLSNYIEILWGARNEYNSMYYLNGKDNNLFLITTHSILKPELRFKESYLTLTAESKRSEMLMQSTALDERENISSIRKLSGENLYFYTYRATFNSPGQLATVIAFDLPISHLLPIDMGAANFSLLSNNEQNPDETNKANISQNGFWLEFSQPLSGTKYKLLYRVSLKDLLIDLLYKNIWLLLADSIFIILSLGGLIYIRKKYIAPNALMSHELQVKDALSNDIISNIPIGLLIYNFSTNQIIMSNKIADHLLPDIDLNKIKMMAKQHHGVIQTSIDDSVYEIKVHNIHLLPETYLFLLQDKDQEALINKRLQLAHLEHDKSVQARRFMLTNISSELKQPIKELNNIAYQLKQIPIEENSDHIINNLLTKSEYISSWVENISFLNELELGDWQAKSESFSLSHMLDDIFKNVLSKINNKGLNYYYHCNINPESIFIGDGFVIRKIILMLVNYAITITSYGKISLIVNYSQKYKDQIQIEVIDTGAGLNSNDLANLNYPFLNKAVGDKYQSNSGLTFYLCDQLCRKLNGHFTIDSKPNLGTHYTISLPLIIDQDQCPQLLEDITALLDISNTEIRKIIQNYLRHYGAAYFDKKKENISREYDIILTDKPYDSARSTILLVGDLAGLEQMTPDYIRCNYNLNEAIINAISLLIERNLSFNEFNEISEMSPFNNEDTDYDIENVISSYRKQLAASDYQQLFIETVPIDINKLYTDIEQHDLISLSQTAHRLKGVFAMLDLEFLKFSCETLEQHITNGNEIEIKNSISRIDSFITRLLQQGN
ncbi:DNA mismatch repair protein MutT [Photorhabdus heterorhabditis]|uniref:Phosphotransferase RcsD n=1 Tax=Photorhabdus heterorhabditis TaxID=880156 RepID=A0ABR5K8N7_9GAMM|nr:phosphotransferase RcsD [Photorhabdus heterorhabditis]KOY60955.1 DNA mismatch repair protein MutT [Photorhabdus heterorhabditis]